MFRLFQLDEATLKKIKRNVGFYIIAALISVIVYQNKELSQQTKSNVKLYEIIRVKDSIVHERDQQVIQYYQNFFVETSKMLVMQKAQINKADTIISKLSGSTK